MTVITCLFCLGLLKLRTSIKTTAIATYKQHEHEFRKPIPMLKIKLVLTLSDVIQETSSPEAYTFSLLLYKTLELPSPTHYHTCCAKAQLPDSKYTSFIKTVV